VIDAGECSVEEFKRYLEQSNNRVLFFNHYQTGTVQRATGDFSSSVRMAYQRRRSGNKGESDE
jgi:hypothetical protein